MNKDEILEASRKENKSKDLAELEVSYRVGNIAGRVGASVCFLILVIVAWITKTVLFSPWILYFSILGTYNLVRYIKLKKKNELTITILYVAMCLFFIALFALRILEAIG